MAVIFPAKESVGALLSILLLPKIPQKLVNRLMIILALAASIRMMLS